MDKNQNVKLIAVCGGIASGKSVVIDALKSCGAKVLSCDEINRQLLQEPDYIALIDSHFNGVVKNGQVDKSALRDIIINNQEKKQLLNSLAHPKILQRLIEKANRLGGVVFVEIPLLSMIKDKLTFDKIWFVKAPNNLRLERLMRRDNMSKIDAEKFIATQAQENDAQEFADRIIVNNDTYNQLCENIKEIYLQELS